MNQPLSNSGPVRVSPDRLTFGSWCHRTNRQTGRGDIRASYSADVIALEGRVRRPFLLLGWMCVMTASRGTKDDCLFEAYRLVPVKAFDGPVTTYRDKVLIDHGDSARRDPLGFYHGMRVTHGNTEFVLSGPAITIVAGDEEPAQGGLFCR